MIIRDRHFRRRDQCQTAIVLEMKKVVFKFWKLISAKQSIAVHDKWGQRLSVTMLACVNVEHKIDQRPFKPRSSTIKNCKSRARDLRCSLLIEYAQRLT